MNTAELYRSLARMNHSRLHPMQIARQITRSQNLAEPLLDLVFNNDDPASVKACRVLECTVIEKVSFLYPYLDRFTGRIPQVLNESAIRPLVRICEHLLQDYCKPTGGTAREVLTMKHMESMTVVCFDWLLGDHKVAAKVYSMGCLLLLGREIHWIHPELRHILERNYSHESAAYKARARYVFSQLKKKV